MTLITKNINDGKPNHLNETALSKKNISYGSAKASLNTAPIKDNVELSTKRQISFKGSPVKVSGIKKFFLGEKPVKAEELLSDITRYIAPTLDNGFVHWLNYAVTNKKNGIVNEEIRIIEPFHKNVIKAFTDLPKLIIRTAKKKFGSDTTKEMVKTQEEKIETRSSLLGLWMNVTKIAGDFDKGITDKKNIKELKEIVKDGITGKEEELSKFFKERKLKSLYSYDCENKKASGILTKSDEHGNYLEKFAEEILSDTPNSQKDSVIEKVKQQYIQKTIDKKMESKQGAFLSSAGASATQFIARTVSGIIPAWFIANDFYNLRMAHSDNKKQANAEWNSKFKQESGRIGIDAYEGYILNSIFEKLTNKSLPFAVGLNIVNTVGSNVFSRKLTGRPVLPINIEEAAKLKHANSNLQSSHAEISSASQTMKQIPKQVRDDSLGVQNDNKLEQLKSFNSFKSNNSAIGFGAGKDTAVKEGLLKVVKKYFTTLDEKFAQACPEKMDVEKFAKDYRKVKEFDRKDAKKMLEIAAKRINEIAKATKNEDKIIKKDMENLSLKDILEHDYVNGQKELIIGRNRVYRYSKEAWNVVKFPFEFSGIVGRALINPALKLLGKKPMEGPEKTSFYSEQFIKNVTKWANKVNKKMNVINEENKEEAISRYAKNKKNFFSTAIMEYAPHELSTAMKFTGFVTVPFLATDAYNVTIGETKNKNSAGKQRNQRAVQDSARQGVSLWISYAFNQMGKALSSASLWGNAAVIAVSAFSYESLTRLLVGQPLLPTTHEKMVETEKEKAKSKNWFVKLMAGRLKTNTVVNSAQVSVKKSETDVKSANAAPAFNSNIVSPNVAELYKKFSGKV